MLFFSLLCLGMQVKAQVVATNANVQTGVYEVAQMDYSIDYSQKMLNWRDTCRIGITTTDTGTVQFFMILRGANVVPYVKLSSDVTVNDFTILGDTLYFCGNVIDDRGDSVGFVAYADITTMFTNPQYKFSLINTNKVGGNPIYDVRKLKAYYNNNNEKIIVGIGSMLFGDPTRDIIDLTDPVSYHGYTRTYYPKLRYDYLMMYKITETPIRTNIEDILLYGATPLYEPANEVILYKNPINSDSLNYAERFQDIVLSDSSIYLVSTSTYTYDMGREMSTHSTNLSEQGHDNMIFIRKIDKNNYQLQEAKMYMLEEQIHPDYGFSVETITENKIAIGKVICDMSTSTTNTKIDICDFSSNIVNRIKIDSVNHRFYVLRNIEYMPAKNTLLVLKSVIGHSGNIGAKNNVFLLDLNNNQNVFPVIIRDLSQPVFNNYYPIWNYVNIYDNTNYYCIGTIGGKLKISDIRTLYDESGCSKVYDREVRTQRECNLVDDSILVQCSFEYPTLGVVEGGLVPTYFSTTTTYKAIVTDQEFNNLSTGEIGRYCEK